ncbi:MAG TPA: sialidase family protein [Anaerolineales bacterium]|nr:sialidase family protein [Anaerolineales bacterium]
MRHSIRLVATLTSLVLLSAGLIGPALASPDDGAVTDQPYIRQDGGSDDTIASCSDDTSTVEPGDDGGGNRQQNEPSVAINPGDPSMMVAGSNDYCTVETTGDSWLGFYVSEDGGETWVNSLNPGYPTDTSAEGQASPIFGRAGASGDPIMDWDNENRLFYGGISFNRTQPNPSGLITPTNGDMIVSTWERDPGSPLGMKYLRTVVVGKGTPSAFFLGRFNDKPSLRVDDWEGSPHNGNVYVAWTLFPGGGQDQVLFSRSTDHGATFSKPIKISKAVANAQGSDIAVAPDGTIYVVWRQFSFVSRGVNDAILFVKSTDGGQHFSDPQTVSAIIPYDRSDRYVSGGGARDCGDGPFLCETDFVFHRQDSLPQAVADVAGNLYVTWEQLIPAADNGDTYHPDGQSQVVVANSSDGGESWGAPVAIDPKGTGHQWWPNLEYDRETGTIVAIYYDSSADPSYSVNRPPGNEADGTSVCGVPGSAVCDVLNTYIATSSDGLSWAPTPVSSVGHQPEYEMFGNRDIPFHGDYLWIDANGGTVFGVWTDNRDVVPGEDPREETQDGFDVLQCRVLMEDGTFGTDNCPNAGGLNQKIYGAGMSLP